MGALNYCVAYGSSPMSIIVVGVPIPPWIRIYIKENRLGRLILCDSGADHLLTAMREDSELESVVREAHKVTIVGDLDSISSESQDWWTKELGAEVVYEPNQGKSDLSKGLDMTGGEPVVVLSSYGYRMDHTIGNLHLGLREVMLRKGRICYLSKYDITFFLNKSEVIDLREIANWDWKGHRVDILTWGDKCVVKGVEHLHNSSDCMWRGEVNHHQLNVDTSCEFPLSLNIHLNIMCNL